MNQPDQTDADTDHPSADALDSAVGRMDRLERSLRRQTVVILILVAALFVCASGWWLSSRDHDATTRNGSVADCRSLELAATLDAFRIIVSPDSTTADQDGAGRTLARLGSLRGRYAACTD